MKYFLITAVATFFTASLCVAQRSTITGTNGKWISTSIWTSGNRPGTISGENVTVSGVDITINGVVAVGNSISSGGTLTFDGNDASRSITVNGTLIVFGNMTFETDAMTLTVNPSGLVIVFGNLLLNNKVNLSSTGNIIVTGQISKNGSQSSIGGGGDFYAGSYNNGANGAQSAIGNGPPDHSLNTGSDLAANLPNVYNFLNCINNGGTGTSCSPSQCVVASSDGYQVYIQLDAVSIVPSSNPCPHGYNYNVTVNYNISFTGSNIPSNLYTLQGNVTCNGQSIFFDLPNNGAQGTLTTTGNPWRSETDCGTATVASLNCNTALLEIHGPGIASQSCNATLPIKLKTFEAGEVADGVLLSWATTKERNFSHFEIQRSHSDELLFETITSLDGKGGLDIETAYQYVDPNPVYGRNYYRLKSVDLDGTIEYSRMIVMNWERGNRISVYPNPVSDKKLTLVVPHGSNVSGQIRMLDEMGYTVYEQNLEKSTTTITLPDNLPGGVYHLRITTENYNKLMKVIVL